MQRDVYTIERFWKWIFVPYVFRRYYAADVTTSPSAMLFRNCILNTELIRIHSSFAPNLNELTAILVNTKVVGRVLVVTREALYFSSQGKFRFFPSMGYGMSIKKCPRENKHFDILFWRIKVFLFLSKGRKDAFYEGIIGWKGVYFPPELAIYFNLPMMKVPFPTLYHELACKQLCFLSNRSFLNRRNEKTEEHFFLLALLNSDCNFENYVFLFPEKYLKN